MNQVNREPMMYVFAGNNGIGKSTIRNLLIDSWAYIDKDAFQ